MEHQEMEALSSEEKKVRFKEATVTHRLLEQTDRAARAEQEKQNAILDAYFAERRRQSAANPPKETRDEQDARAVRVNKSRSAHYVGPHAPFARRTKRVRTGGS
jgi:hypothetical protein